MPLEDCKLSRSDCQTAADKGYCASQNTHYYGYKLHAVCTTSGVFASLDLTKASVHDIHNLRDIKDLYQDCTMLGNEGYLSIDYQLDLFETKKFQLEVPMRINQHNYQPQIHIFRKARKRIETLFSQLCDQFMIRRSYAKSFDGFKNRRVLSKITALTVYN